MAEPNPNEDATSSPAVKWGAPPERLSLEARDVHVWSIPLAVAGPLLSRFSGFLSADERERAARFHFEHDRNRFVAGRGALRQLLGSYLDQNPGDLQFTSGPFGKPSLVAGSQAPELHFNLAHSNDLALLAVGRLPNIGVDIERIRSLLDFDDLVTRFFSSREAGAFQVLGPESKPEAFFNLWTRKEAWLKATGEGIGYSLNLVEVSFLPGEPARLLALPEYAGPVGAWRLCDLMPAAGYAAALAVKANKVDVKCWEWRLEGVTVTDGQTGKDEEEREDKAVRAPLGLASAP